MLPITSIKITAEHLVSEPLEYLYSVAGAELIFSREVPSLVAYFIESRAVSEPQEPYEFLDSKWFELCYHGTAPFANSLRDVKFYRSADAAQIDIDDVPACQISLSRNRIHLINNADFDSEVNLELLTGPALILLLAQQNIFCLHAGAVATPFGNIAIIAESGAGKSTLSAHVDNEWSQLSDDILPMLSNQLLTNFPQLKLPNATSKGALDGDKKLAAILRVNPVASDAIHFKQFSSVQAMLQIVRHTVAAKLFDSTLLSAHAEFAKHLASDLPIIELSYPRDLSQLSELRQAIVLHLENAFNTPNKSL